MNQFQHILSLFDVKTSVKTIRLAMKKANLSKDETLRIESMIPAHEEWLGEMCVE